MENLKQELQEEFNKLFKGKRLLAIQLNGFDHSVFFDNGSVDSQVECERYSGYFGESERQLYKENYTDRAKELLKGFGHYTYQHNPQEIIFLLPNER